MILGTPTIVILECVCNFMCNKFWKILFLEITFSDFFYLWFLEVNSIYS